MGDIVNLNNYKKSKQEEKERIRKIYVNNNHIKTINSLTQNAKTCMGISIITKHIDSYGEIDVKEIGIDSDLLNVILDAINTYKEALMCDIKEFGSK